MKKLINSCAGLMFAVLIISSCSKQSAVETNTPAPNPKNFKLNATANGEPLFKTGHSNENDKIVVTWKKGDQVGLFSVVNSTVKNANAAFEILEQTDISNAGKNANFSGEISQSVDWSADLYTYYPYRELSNANYRTVPISVEGQVQNGANYNHLAKYDFLIGSAKQVNLTQPNVQIDFKHVMAIADFNISLPGIAQDVELFKVRIIRSNNLPIYTQGSIDLSTGQITAKNEENSPYHKLELQNSTLKSGEKFTATLAMFPSDWTGETLTFFIDTSIGTFKLEKTGIKMEAGKRYKSELALTSAAIPVNIGDYYYSDGTWSSNLNTNKTAVGVVVYKGQKGGAINGYVMALQNANNNTILTKDIIVKPAAFDIPEIKNVKYHTPKLTPTGVWYFLENGEEDWDGFQNTNLVYNRRNEPLYNQCGFVSIAKNYAPTGVLNGPAAKGNWYTPAISQLMVINENYRLVDQKIEAAKGRTILAEWKSYLENDDQDWTRRYYLSSTEAFKEGEVVDKRMYTVRYAKVEHQGHVEDGSVLNITDISTTRDKNMYLRPFLSF